jgi:hypothetical protein
MQAQVFKSGTQLLIQILGVFVGFLISLWVASKISPSLSIENAFLISFFLVLLNFSNLWSTSISISNS